MGQGDNSEQISKVHFSCLENPTDREAWWAAVHGVAKSPWDMTEQEKNQQAKSISLRILNTERSSDFIPVFIPV